MYKLILKEKIISTIDNFVDKFLYSSINLYVDTWIRDIDLIIKNYETSAVLFRDKIYDTLEEKFIQDNILWKKISEDNQLLVMISVWNYRLFVDYSEDESQKLRIIENIEFYKK
jgi:hypothetical protein